MRITQEKRAKRLDGIAELESLFSDVSVFHTRKNLHEAWEVQLAVLVVSIVVCIGIVGFLSAAAGLFGTRLSARVSALWSSIWPSSANDEGNDSRIRDYPASGSATGSAGVSAEERIRYVEGVQGSRTVALLGAGSIMGFFAFASAAYLSFYETPMFTVDLNGKPFKSGLPYYPETVSEMVQNPDSPSGKCFFGFCMVGAICILLSWYPWQLRNVYVGDDVWAFRGQKGIFLHLRSLLPPIGMLMVACLRVKPKHQRTPADVLTCNLHTVGAVVAIGGFCGLEFMTLLFYNHHDGQAGRALFHGKERCIRIILAVCCAICVFAFQMAGVLANTQDFGSADKWAVPTQENIDAAMKANRWNVVTYDARLMNLKLPGLVDTATGKDLLIKQIEFWAEILAGMFMILSHMAIWVYCEERHIKLGAEKPRCGAISESFVDVGHGQDSWTKPTTDDSD
jgi:hypothetical protein